MRKILAVLAAAALAAGPATATAQADVMATVRQFVDSFNQGDAKATLAACADQTSIIDAFPPHEWHGAVAVPVTVLCNRLTTRDYL